MSQAMGTLVRQDTVMFEYDVHDMRRAVGWYRDVFGFEVIFEGGGCHTEFALPVEGARLALSLADEDRPIRKGARLFLRTEDIRAVEDYLKAKHVKARPIENVEDVVLILWLEDPDANHLAFEQRTG
jgi:catechol 2,3-dioxygenase-like lactoylglutathione lyase family enzyme